jgi:hypothetical protein
MHAAKQKANRLTPDALCNCSYVTQFDLHSAASALRRRSMAAIPRKPCEIVKLGVQSGANASEVFEMPILPPVAASGAREPERAARRIPLKVRACVVSMVNDGLNFIEASQLHGLRPATMRTWLHRPEIAALVREERRAYRLAISCATERALVDVRDNAENSMARVSAAKAICEIDREEYARPHAGERASPGVSIRILNVTTMPTAPSSFVNVPLIDGE